MKISGSIAFTGMGNEIVPKSLCISTTSGKKAANCHSEMLTLQHKVESYERLLEQLSLQVDGPAQLAIQKAIGKVSTQILPFRGMAC